MDYLNIPGLPLPLSTLVLGTEGYVLEESESCEARLDAWFDGGGNIVDSGRRYGNGESERVIGNWIARRGIRDEFNILTKGCHPDGMTRRVTKRHLDEDLAGSLDALGTDYIDLYFLHRDDPSVPVGEIIEWLNEHKAAGAVRVLGASNWTRQRVAEANKYAEENGLSGFAATSNYAGLAAANEPMWWECVEMDEEYREWQIETQTPNFCWSALAHGFFSGRYSPEDEADGDQTHKDIVRTYYGDDNWRRFHRAGEAHHWRDISAVQIACAYVISKPYPSFAVAWAANVEELEELFEAAEVKLSLDELEWLKSG